ncbi:MAG TPA: LytTR family DNA-binding domain-containing protein [Chitinophagaceae bacterium]
MIRTILVDDEPRGLNTLRKLLQEYCPDLSVVAEAMDANAAKEKIEELDPQLVFLDVSLAGKTSFDVLKQLKKIEFEIIFVTAHDGYALQAFQYSAVDYLVKPIDEDLLVSAVKRAVKRITTNSISENLSTLLYNIGKPGLAEKMKLCIPSLQGFQVVELSQILFCEASGSYTNFHFVHQPLICSAKPIHEYEEMLADSGFIRIHKSYLVNLLHIHTYIKGEGGMVILSNNKEIQVSRRKKDLFINKMKAFYKY